MYVYIYIYIYTLLCLYLRLREAAHVGRLDVGAAAHVLEPLFCFLCHLLSCLFAFSWVFCSFMLICVPAHVLEPPIPSNYM